MEVAVDMAFVEMYHRSREKLLNVHFVLNVIQSFFDNLFFNSCYY